MLPHEPVSPVNTTIVHDISMEQHISNLIQRYPNPVEKYEHKVRLKGNKAKMLIKESGDPKAMEMLAMIDEKKSYTFTKIDYRPVNLMRRIKQFEKEKRSERYIIEFILKLHKSQEDYFREKLNLNGDKSFLPAPEGGSSEHQSSGTM